MRKGGKPDAQRHTAGPRRARRLTARAGGKGFGNSSTARCAVG